MRAIILFVVCLAPLLMLSAAECDVDAVFSQDDVQNIRKFIASITDDQIESINSVGGDKHDVGSVPVEAINIARDGTRSPVTLYSRTDLASVVTSDKNHVQTEYRVQKGSQGWAMEIERYSWYYYPVECLWYLLPGGILHSLFFGLGCVFLIFVQLWTRSGYGKLLWRWGQFNIVFFLVAVAVNGFWSCLIFGHFYTSTDYIADFSPLVPIMQSVIDARFGNQVGHLYGITLRQLQLIWLAFSGITWVLALSIYFRIRRFASSPSARPNQALEPTPDRT